MKRENDDRMLLERLEALRADPPGDGGFEASLHRRLVAAGPPEEPSLWRRILLPFSVAPRRMMWPALGLASGVATFVLLGMVVNRTGNHDAPFASPKAPSAAVSQRAADEPALAGVESARTASAAAGTSAARSENDGSPEEATAEVPTTKVAVVRLTLSAEISVESAAIRVTLPEGLVFWSDGEALAQRSFEWTQSLEAGENVIPIAVRGQQPGSYRIAVSARLNDQQLTHEVVLKVLDG